MALLRLFDPTTQFQIKSGALNVAGKLRIYVESTDDLANIYGDDLALLSQPLILDSNGRARGLFVDSGRSYRLEAYDRNDSLLFTIRRLEPNASGTIVSQTVFIKGTPDEIDVEDSVTEKIRTYTVSLSAKVKGKIDENREAILKESEARKDADDELRKMIDNNAEAGTASPLMDGKASVGNSLKYAREDHIHPSDTSREDIANKTTVVLGTSDSKYPTDKAVAEFVNSSIATNTANYISNNGEPFTSVEQLEAYSGPVTNNDYAFVTGIDSEGNTYYDRYKATVSGSTVTWALEYRLNNSSFTAAQWSAINSGITSALVAKIHDHSNKDVLDGITSDKVNSWDRKQDSLPTRGTASSTYAINISGNSTSATNWHGAIYGTANSANTKRYVYLGRKKRSDYGCLIGILTTCSRTDTMDVYVIRSGWSRGNFGNNATVQRISSGGTAAPSDICLYNHEITENDTVYSELWCYIPTKSNEVDFIFRTLFNFFGTMTLAASVVNRAESEFTGTLTKCANSNSRNIAYSPTNKEVGSASVPVYVTNAGAVTACTDDFVHDGDVTSTYSSTGTAPVNGKAVAAAIGGLDVSSVGGDGKYISAISETDGKISAVATTMDTTPTAGSTNPVTSGGIKTALEVLQSNIDDVDAKGIVINEINGENVICFE